MKPCCWNATTSPRPPPAAPPTCAMAPRAASPRPKPRRELPGLRADGLRGGVLYHDGQFDDARLAVSLAQSAWDHGATPINYCQVTGLLRAGGAGTPGAGVGARDRATGPGDENPATPLGP